MAWRRPLRLCLGLSLLLVLTTMPVTAQQQAPDEEPAGTARTGPVRIVPVPTEDAPAAPARRPQAPARSGEVTVNLGTVDGLAIAAGTPLWIVDSTRGRLIACTLERRVGDPRITCTTRPLP